LNLVSTPPYQQNDSYGEANGCEAAPDNSGLLKEDFLRYGVIAAAELVETIPPSPVALIKREPEKAARHRGQ
jgi:hypothetical protein